MTRLHTARSIVATLAALAALAASAPALQAQRYVPTADPEHPRIKFADSLTSLNDRCMVARSKLSMRIRPVYVNGQPLAFCCARCPIVFAEDPDRYLREHQIQLRDPIHPERKADYDDLRNRRFVGLDLYFFADTVDRDRFLAEPYRWEKALTDPVTMRRFRLRRNSPSVVHAGERWWFATDSTRKAFAATPDSFTIRRGI